MSLIKDISKNKDSLFRLSHASGNLQQFTLGIKALFYGFRLSVHPKIRHYVMIPLVINVVIFASGSYLLFSWAEDSVLVWLFGLVPAELPSFLSWLDPIIGWLMGLIKLLIWIGLILGILFLVASGFTAVAHSIAAPFNAYLAEKVEKIERPTSYPDFTIRETIIRSVKRELSRLLYWIPRAIGVLLLCLVIGWIPLINVTAPAIWALFGAWMLSMQYLDYASDNNGLEINDTIKKMHKHKLPVLGFGSATVVATLIPIVNWFVITGAVVGGTLLWVYILDIEVEKVDHAPE